MHGVGGVFSGIRWEFMQCDDLGLPSTPGYNYPWLPDDVGPGVYGNPAGYEKKVPNRAVLKSGNQTTQRICGLEPMGRAGPMSPQHLAKKNVEGENLWRKLIRTQGSRSTTQRGLRAKMQQRIFQRGGCPRFTLVGSERLFSGKPSHTNVRSTISHPGEREYGRERTLTSILGSTRAITSHRQI